MTYTRLISEYILTVCNVCVLELIMSRATIDAMILETSRRRRRSRNTICQVRMFDQLTSLEGRICQVRFFDQLTSLGHQVLPAASSCWPFRHHELQYFPVELDALGFRATESPVHRPNRSRSSLIIHLGGTIVYTFVPTDHSKCLFNRITAITVFRRSFWTTKLKNWRMADLLRLSSQSRSSTFLCVTRIRLVQVNKKQRQVHWPRSWLRTRFNKMCYKLQHCNLMNTAKTFLPL